MNTDELIIKKVAMKRLGIRSHTTMDKYIKQGMLHVFVVPWHRGPMFNSGEIQRIIDSYKVEA